MRLALSLELRPLPSTGVTQLRQYYEPLRHPKEPGLSLAGIRLAVPGHAKGLPVLHALSLCTCRRHYPGAAVGRRLRSFARPYQPSPLRLPGRPAQCHFRGLLGVHSRCGLHTRAVTDSCPALSEGFGHFVTSMAAPVASGGSEFPGWGLHPLESAAFARRTSRTDVQDNRTKFRSRSETGRQQPSRWPAADAQRCRK